ncbi:MAG: hypothetical protein A2046_16185 [Bacteroidetes bacterium GWA2_30_7]|nr:MAG: hypothetical protein A2046_16185 [Bacteroidetes bacterium GWA2_30_7]
MKTDYAGKMAIKIAKLIDLNPPDLTNVYVDIIKKAIVEAMTEQKYSDIRIINETRKDNSGKVVANLLIDCINKSRI